MLDVKAAALPPVRTKLDLALADIDQTGVAILANGVPITDIEEARAMTMSLAASEVQEGCAMFAGGTQRVYGLIQKGAVFRRIATNPNVLALAHRILGPKIILYSSQTHLVPKGGQMDSHFDQLQYSPFIPMAAMCAVIVMLEPFSAANGATGVAIGHNATSSNDAPPPPEAFIPLEGDAGTLGAFGGLLWHSTGINSTDTPRCGLVMHFCVPWIRPHENFQRTISTAVARNMTREMRDLLGVHDRLVGRRWHAYEPEHMPKQFSPDE